ncbi:hypothetical protein [Lentzea sp. NPDC003310]|uniref:hypothetical protein n=1 Tax=Lentzea sp. NPDC003310 TaxID=3154447 RepID=UPI0033B2BC7C
MAGPVALAELGGWPVALGWAGGPGGWTVVAGLALAAGWRGRWLESVTGGAWWLDRWCR